MCFSVFFFWIGNIKRIQKQVHLHPYLFLDQMVNTNQIALKEGTTMSDKSYDHYDANGNFTGTTKEYTNDSPGNYPDESNYREDDYSLSTSSSSTSSSSTSSRSISIFRFIGSVFFYMFNIFGSIFKRFFGFLETLFTGCTNFLQIMVSSFVVITIIAVIASIIELAFKLITIAIIVVVSVVLVIFFIYVIYPDLHKWYIARKAKNAYNAGIVHSTVKCGCPSNDSKTVCGGDLVFVRKQDSNGEGKVWKCSICGNFHYGD